MGACPATCIPLWFCSDCCVWAGDLSAREEVAGLPVFIFRLDGRCSWYGDLLPWVRVVWFACAPLLRGVCPDAVGRWSFEDERIDGERWERAWLFYSKVCSQEFPLRCHVLFVFGGTPRSCRSLCRDYRQWRPYITSLPKRDLPSRRLCIAVFWLKAYQLLGWGWYHSCSLSIINNSCSRLLHKSTWFAIEDPLSPSSALCWVRTISILKRDLP